MKPFKIAKGKTSGQWFVMRRVFTGRYSVVNVVGSISEGFDWLHREGYLVKGGRARGHIDVG